MAFLFYVFLVGFFVGAVAVIGLEVLGLWFVMLKLKQKNSKLEKELRTASKDVDLHQSLEFAYHKEGNVWVLEAERIPKNWLEKVSREHERKKKFFEVTPVRKHARIKGHHLILTETDGSPSSIQLKGCLIEAVSASELPSRKWAKKFPIKLENKSSVIYRGSKVLHIYLETSWEKESWCKALRLACGDDKCRSSWFSKLQVEFKSYVMSLRDGYLSFMKPQAAFYNEPMDKENRTDGSSKVRLMWKKFSRKVSRAGAENKSAWTSVSGREEKKPSEKVRAYQDFVSGNGSGRATPLIKAAKSSTEESNCNVQSSSSLPRSASQSQVSTISDADSEDRIGVDEGTLCWNLLISRLFFDIKSSQEIGRSIQDRIQRSLFNMRTPSYVGEVICTKLDPGSLPPYIHSMKVLPFDMNDVWAFEVDFEYCGGLVLEIETRIEVRELDKESNSVKDVSSDLLEGFEQFGKQFDASEGRDDELKKKSELENERSKGTKSNMPAGQPTAAPNPKSRWKSMVNSIAKHVSQVPVTLRISVASFRGTMRLHIKPPPSDQLWFSFTSMPEIDFNLESSLGDHKITSSHVALFLINRFKAAIRETMVLPNFESICVPFMSAEKNDWIPRKASPFIWINPELSSSSAEKPGALPTEPRPPIDHTKEHSEGKRPSTDESFRALASILNPREIPRQSKSMQDLTAALLVKNDIQEDFVQRSMRIPNHDAVSRSISLHENPNSNAISRSISLQESSGSSPEDDTRPKAKLGRRARMLDIGKRMSEKLEEKRRHIEEKGRNIVEKMRGP